MKVNINNESFYVRWEYVRDKKGRPKQTNCFLHIVKDDEKIIVSKGIASLHKNDVFNKDLGRIISLTRALSDFPKEMRVKFWQVYTENVNTVVK